MIQKISRRNFNKLALLSLTSTYFSSEIANAKNLFENLASTELGPKVNFSFKSLISYAKFLSEKNWTSPPLKHSAELEKIDYDAYQKIRFRKEKTLSAPKNKTAALQFFHLGKYFKDPIKIHLVSENMARELLYTPNFFEIPEDHIARQLPKSLGFAGFRVMEKGLNSDWLAFLGASYFRASAPFNQYGLSARGIAIDTAMPTPEEFPRFTSFWLEPANNNDNAITIYAILEGPSVTGAYKFSCKREKNMVMDTDVHIFARKDIARLGIAPLTSMFWYSETNRKQAVDWRPEIHDSDGLAIWTGNGERIWRPLNNPPILKTNVFQDQNPKGFGLLQRDRSFQNYQDDGVFYDRRPSLWVEPNGNWGKGSVHLVEIPTNDETFDNIVAYWTPSEKATKAKSFHFSYKLHWLDDIDFPADLAKTVHTFTGMGGVPGHKRPDGTTKYVIDFQGRVFDGLARTDTVKPIISSSNGEIQNPYCYPIVGQKNQWRLIFDLKPEGQSRGKQKTESRTIDLRAFLSYKGKALTETWLYQYVA